MKQVEVSILGQAYTLGCPEGGEELLVRAVAAVDREMTNIRDAGKVKARERIAVLAALNLAYQIAEQGLGAAHAAHAANGAAAASHDAVDGVDVDELLRRVDAALADDGQLL
ncbi:MAG: cell division protein ZapA [Betaproteobacteria bacterium]|nr:cell division protein ZapA [Betaproteobacteria bacterium]MCC6247123.1 cell division protein ZapA [Rubrivivax sp.]MCL4696867.1 cell division protein ZapA [Burkholderiaceae bacterium]